MVVSISLILFLVPCCLAALLSIPLFLRLKWPSPVLWFIKLYASALSPVLVLIGLACLSVGLVAGSAFAGLTGLYVTVIFLTHIFLVTRPPGPPGSFENAYGKDWEERIGIEKKKYFLRDRVTLRLPKVPEPLFEQNISFATIPGTGTELLCDTWQPHPSIVRSGLAFIYVHGSAWYFLDKDLGTRPFFRHLAAQGHVIMDVANRLAPDTDMMGMINDVKRAIVWMKENSGRFGIRSDRIVVGGGSAGAHLALMAAYTASNPQFSPPDLAGKDVSVCSVISMYGPTDLEAMYYHTNQHLTTLSIPGKPKKSVPTHMPPWIIKIMGKEYYRLHMDKDMVNAGAFAPLLGGHPDENPTTYALFSPVTHMHTACPPTLLIHGAHDLMAPVKTTRTLFARLKEQKAQSVMHILPQTDHAFDLQLPKLSPAAHNAIYDVERFLALQTKIPLNSEKNMH